VLNLYISLIFYDIIELIKAFSGGFIYDLL
jgi:hypothetical protein